MHTTHWNKRQLQKSFRCRAFLLRIWLLIGLIFGLLTPAVGAEPVVLQGEHIALAGHLEWLADVDGDLGIDDVRGAAAARFQPLAGELTAGLVVHPVWLRFSVQQPVDGPRDWLLESSSPLTARIELYLPDADGRLRRVVGGTDTPRDEWAVDARMPVFHMALPPSPRVQSVYLRLSSRHALNTNLTLWQADSFHAMSRRDALGYGLYYGTLLLLALFQLAFFYRSRSAVNLVYLLYLTNSAWVSMLGVGLVQQVLTLPGIPADVLFGTHSILGVTLFTQFVSMQFDIAQRQPWIARLLKLVTWTAVPVVATLLTLGFYRPGVVAYQVIALAGVVFLFTDAIWLLYRGHKLDRLLLTTFVVIAVTIAVSYLHALGLLLSEMESNLVYHGGKLLHLLVMSVALGRHDRQLEVEKRQAQAETVATMRRLNAELETTVAERTAELRRALDVERQAREDQREFVAMVSHEFRTPLAIIDTSLQHLENRLTASDEKARTRFDNAGSAVLRMVSLLDNCLSQDRLDSDHLRLQTAAVDLPALLHDLVDEWPAGRVQATLSLALVSQTRAFVCDPHLLSIALRNLLTNADRHCSSGALQLLAEWENDGVCIRVVDQGDGIAADDIQHLFRKYFRGGAALRKPGAGLGLYLVQRIAELHGGTIGVTSTLGQGSTFTLRVPTAA